jgi:cation diffusion facilitator CzcD-associated flavoprotein CzcO
MLDTALIGAGPFGLSIAAHLKSAGVVFRIFGAPMHTWLEQMPRGMRLKSEGFASTLYDPASSFTLEEYCRQRCLPYAGTGLPVPLETFSSYGLEFQKRFVPELEKQNVTSVRRSGSAFSLELSNGESLAARKVVVAVGLTHFQYVPAIFSGVPWECLSHSSQHRTFDRFQGREVAVVGAGASAADTAALLHRAGASVSIIARRQAIAFHEPPPANARSLWQRARWPMTGLGPGWKLVFYAKGPLLFQRMPESYRLAAVRNVLGPAPGWFVRDEVINNVHVNTGVRIARADVRNGRVRLNLVDGTGTSRTVSADHVIAATGYRVDLRRLTFLHPEILGGIRSVENTPELSRHFESSVPGLYFVGVASANTFGPLVRFAYGAGFTARRLSRHLASGRMGFRTPWQSRDHRQAADSERFPAGQPDAGQMTAAAIPGSVPAHPVVCPENWTRVTRSAAEELEGSKQ